MATVFGSYGRDAVPLSLELAFHVAFSLLHILPLNQLRLQHRCKKRSRKKLKTLKT